MTNMPKMFQNATFGLSLLVIVASKKVRHNDAYDLFFSRLQSLKSSYSKYGILSHFGFNLIVFFCAVALINGCATTNTYRKPPYNAPADDASIKLAEAANAVSDSMLQMAKTEKVLTPPNQDNTLTIPSSYPLQTHASVDWSGPIAEVTARVAKAAHYRIRILGQAPSIPILISLNMQDKSLAEILRNIDYQAGQKAFIHVYPHSQVVELRYANNYS